MHLTVCLPASTLPAPIRRATNISGIPQPVICSFTLTAPLPINTELRLEVQAVRTIAGRPKTLYSELNELFTYKIQVN